MDRRQVLKSIGAAALVQMSPVELVALASETHAQLRARSATARHIFHSLDPHQNETVIVVSELILPETDTPGAKAAKVNEFVDVMLAGWFDDAERRSFYRGLAALDRDGTRFIDLDEAAQVSALAALEDDTGTLEPVSSSPAGQPFFAVMKWLTLYGYYTSRVGMERELGHEPIPGSYRGCARFNPYEI